MKDKKITSTNYVHYHVWNELWKKWFISKKQVLERFLKEWIDYQIFMLTFRNMIDSWIIEEYHNWVFINKWDYLNMLELHKVLKFIKCYRKDARLSWSSLLFHKRILKRKETDVFLFMTKWKSEEFFIKWTFWDEVKIKLVNANELEYELLNEYDNNLKSYVYSNEKLI